MSFRMAITPYYASLIDPNDPLDPVRMQAVPSGRELELCPDDLNDPLNETGDSPAPHIVHRYPDRVLLLGHLPVRHVLPPLHPQALGGRGG